MSGFKGVKKSGNSYTVCLTIDRKSVYLGTCKSAVEAARLYDLHALKHHQEFAALNFPESRADYEAELVKFPNPRGKYRWKTKWLDR